MERAQQLLCERIPECATQWENATNIDTYLDQKYSKLQQECTRKYNATYLEERLEELREDRNEEERKYGTYVERLCDQFTKGLEEKRHQIEVRVVMYDADTHYSGDESKILRFAIDAFLAHLSAKMYRHAVGQKEEIYSDACDGTCIRCTKIIHVTVG